MAFGESGHSDSGKPLKCQRPMPWLALLATTLLSMGCAAAPVCPTDRPISAQEEMELVFRLSREELARCLVAREPERFVKGPAKPYRGKVVDAETAEPIAGAVVIAVWDREFTGAGGRVPEFYDAREVLTDEAGDFVLDADDIETAAPYNTRWPVFGIYKPGYGFYPRYVSPWQTLHRDLRSGQAIVRLRRLLTRQERLENLATQFSYVPAEKREHLLKAISAERKALGLSP